MAKDPNGVIHAAFSEVNSNPPKVVQSTYKKYGASRARKQQVAIALSKARKAGASIPRGGKTQ